MIREGWKRLLPGLVLTAWLGAQPQLTVPVRLIAVDSGTPPTIYVVLGLSGILRSTDGGSNYRAVYIKSPGQIQPFITELTADPVTPRVVYAAGDTEDGGVWKSTDAGETWREANRGLPKQGEVVVGLQILPAAPQTLYAIAGTAIMKTVDGTESWTMRGTLPVGATAFVVHPRTAGLMFAVSGNTVHKSMDDGASWTSSGNPLSLGIGTSARGITTDAMNTTHIYVAAQYDPRRGVSSVPGNGIYRSNDEGKIFSRLTATQPNDVVTDPAGRPLVYSYSPGLAAIDRSVDQGQTWSRSCYEFKDATRTACREGVGGISRLAIHPKDPNALWAATDQGLYVSSNAGSTWVASIGTVRPTLAPPPRSFDFQLPAARQGSLELGVRVAESAQWTLPISVTATAERWLALSGQGTATPSTVNVRVNTQGLEPGDYTATIRVTSPQAANDPLLIPVKLKVLAAGPEIAGYSIASAVGIGLRGNFGDGGQAARSAVGNVDSVVVDRQGTLYLSDPSNHVIRRVTRDGVIRRWAGNGSYGSTGDGGEALLASLRNPRGLGVDVGGTLYFAESDSNAVRSVTAGGTIGHALRGLPGVRGVAVDNSGNLYAALPGLHVVVRFRPGGSALRYAGSEVQGFRGDGGIAPLARLSGPFDVAVDSKGVVYIADTENNRIRAVEPDGRIRTVAGNGLAGFQGDGDNATEVALFRPAGVAVDAAGNLFIADTDNHRIRMVTPDGKIRTIAGTGTAGYSGDGGPASGAQLRAPSDVAVDSEGNIFAADPLNFRIRKLVPPPPPPQLVTPGIASENGVVNGADGSTGLAPGGLFRIEGSMLAAVTRSAGETEWPVKLDETAVTFNGVAAPLSMVSAGQIRGQVPFEVGPGPAKVRVMLGTQASGEVDVEVLASAPAILESAPGRALAQNADGLGNSAESPALTESTITVFLTGQGAVEPAVPSGSAATGDPPSVAVLAASAKFGDIDAEVTSLTLAPGLIGVARASIRVPAGLEVGDHALTIQVGERVSKAALISFK